MRRCFSRPLAVHLACVAILIAMAVALNMLAWAAKPDPFPETLWNVLVLPALRAVALFGGIALVIFGGTSPVTLRVLRMHARRSPSSRP